MNVNLQPDDSEISLVDILRFLKGAYKVIFTFGVFGLVLAIAYLGMAPKHYEASVQIMMAQIGATNNISANNINNSNNNLNPLGLNIEEPTLLVSRLSSPASFPPEVTRACGLQDQANPSVSLSNSIKLIIPKGVSNVVEIKILSTAPEVAEECALAIFELVRVTQGQIVEPYIEAAKIKLADDEHNLAKAKDLVAKADKSGSAIGVAYLSTRDEIRYLLDEITSLKSIVISSQNRTTRLVAPVYVNNTPIAPKKRVVLAAGLFGGLFFGLLITLARRASQYWQSR